jgi:predicted NAD/FAD-binding protein
MLFDIVRFNTFACDLLMIPPANALESVGEYLEREGYSKQFRDDYLLPMTGSIWSTDIKQCRQDFPIGTLIRFMYSSPYLTDLLHI